MRRLRNVLALVMVLSACSVPVCAATNELPAEVVAALEAQVARLERQLAEQRTYFEAQLDEMRATIGQLSAAKPATAPAQGQADARPDELDSALREAAAQTDRDTTRARPFAPADSRVQSLNPDISVIIDTFFHSDDAEAGIHHVLEEMAGFGHSHGDDEHGHSHLQDGFNLRHLELQLSGEVDPYFKAWATGAFSEHSAELEEAVIQTICLPAGFQVQAGKFFSNFGRINAQHSHEWDFVDQPLIYQLTLGAHGLNEKGAQLSWLAPVPFHLLLGGEALLGENELVFHHLDDEQVPRKDGPRLWVGWLKCAPNLPDPHGLQLGVSVAQGVHQEAHDGNSDGTNDHWLDGDSTFYNADLVYKYDSPQPYGQGDFTLQGEYMYRSKDLSVAQHDLMPAFVGGSRTDHQDGYYLQGLYGFLPRWRVGVRWEQVGLTNESAYPDGSAAKFGASHRVGAMLDFTPTEFSRLRLQVNHGDYEAEDGSEEVWQLFLQWMISLGTHGAHSF